jgi:hypothetical protein
MTRSRAGRRSLGVLALACLVLARVDGQTPTSSPKTQGPAARDGQADFDFEIGTWRTHLRRLTNPLSGSTTWVEYDGTSMMRKVGGGPANIVELDVRGAAGRIEGFSLRLYNPQSRQWSLHYSSRTSGTLEPPVVGGFSNGRGEFYGHDTLNDRAIRVRFVISDITPTSCHFEQAFSADGGRTWETNWIATDTRLRGN